jgi:hypothetical protein
VSADSSGPAAATSCAETSAAAGEALAGTATQAVHWLVVEQRGAWGRDAVADTELPEAVAGMLASFDGRVLLVRRPDRRGPETVVFHAETTEAGGTLTRLTLPGADALTDVVVAREGERLAGPLLLVCAHGRRDPCCARLGLPVFDALAPHVDPALLWQSSHHGGHRFAANLLALPAGVQLGRVTPVEAPDVASLLGEGRIPLDLYRGRTAYPVRVQAAEVAVRRRLGLDGVAELTLAGERGGGITFTHTGGEVTVRVEERPGPALPASCGAEPEETVRYVISF